mmetsp:Transcript_4823/g.8376  ORF Transcript_4823/g.8376 Transcript_4823/m.8376 type:complete len:470 (+) Transcript_4823:45-1454(+)
MPQVVSRQCQLAGRFQRSAIPSLSRVATRQSSLRTSAGRVPQATVALLDFFKPRAKPQPESVPTYVVPTPDPNPNPNPGSNGAAPANPRDDRARSLAHRHATVLKHFPKSLAVDDFMARVECALGAFNFNGDNTIAMSNLCRDELCMVLEDKIESVFGSCFSTHGLGGILSCGVIGIKAGLSHSPVCPEGKERYVFFSLPHIGIDSDGTVGAISRPGRVGAGSACGALTAVAQELKQLGLDACCQSPGTHDPLDPEYSILKQRLARRLRHEGADSSKLDLIEVTKAAERTITSDLEYLIGKAVDPAKADYAVFTGVQIHNWSTDLTDPDIPSFEFISLGKSYVVIDGVRSYLDITQVPALSPRQLKVLANASSKSGEGAHAEASDTSYGMINEIPREYLVQRLGGGVRKNPGAPSRHQPTWKEYMTSATYDDAHPDAPKLDEHIFISQEKTPEAEKFNPSFAAGSGRKA